jgi:hypothetical protein
MNRAVPQRFDRVSRDHAEITVMRAVFMMGELPPAIMTHRGENDRRIAHFRFKSLAQERFD